MWIDRNLVYQTQKEGMVGVRYLLWRWTVQSVAAIPTVLRSMMTVAFCLYDFRIISLKNDNKLRERSH